MLKWPHAWLFQPLYYGLKQTLRHLVETTILIHGYFYPKTWVVWITSKQPKNLGCFYKLVFTVSYIICEWIWQNPTLTHRATLGDMAISSINCIIAPWWIMLKKWKLQQVLVYSLAIIVWVNNFQTPKIQAAAFFVTVMIFQVVAIGVVGGGSMMDLI